MQAIKNDPNIGTGEINVSVAANCEVGSCDMLFGKAYYKHTVLPKGRGVIMPNSEKFQHMLNQFQSATTKIQILPVDLTAVEHLNDYVNFNSQSYFGIVITQTGGIVVDQWLRVYGCGELGFVSRNKDLAKYGKMIVAEDVCGGLFAMTAEGKLSYFAPDTLEWEEMELTYGEFLFWITVADRLQQFYETFRFPDWESMVEEINIEQGIGYFPFLWAEAEKEERHKEILPIKEIQALQYEFLEKMVVNSREV